MTLLALYDRARVALAEATRVDQVMSVRAEIEHVKLYAKQIQDRELLADATIIQMRTERRLGVLLAAAAEAGEIGKGRQNATRVVTLKDIGVDRKLSSKAQKAAAMPEEAFEHLTESTRDKIKSGGAILVDPIKAAAKDDEVATRRAAHAARTQNGGCIEDLGQLALSGRKFTSIGSDPQWKFLTRSAAGEGRSANVHYKTEEVDKIKALPVGELLADDGAFYMWMVDWCPQDALDLLAHWGLKHVTTAFTWVKTNGDSADLDVWSNSTWAFGQGYWTRANPEQCWLATKGNPKRLYADVRQLIIAPVMEHSRKPDEWLDRIERLTEGDYLELQARRPRKGWTSWGDELEWTGVAA
jgi:N6-adenosine-specific RNA methylase IME4